MIKKYMVAYISPKYGLLMTQVEVETDGDYFLGFNDLCQALLAEGETMESIREITRNCDWGVKEIK